jgi:protein pelota
MRVDRRAISAKDGAGIVRLVAEDPEDMWHVYNIVAEGDRVFASTHRKVSSVGS